MTCFYSRARFCLVFLAIFHCAALLIPKGQAQAPDLSSVNAQTQAPVPGAGHDYQHLLNETVDLGNLGVSFKISFPVAKGRGITLPYAWSYNSSGVNPLNMLDGNDPQWDNRGIQTGPEVDGWNTYSGIPYAAVSVWDFTPPQNQYQTFAGCNYQSGMTFTDASGVLHNLNTAAEATASTQSGLVQTCGTQGYMPANGDGQVTAKPDPNTAANDLQTDLYPSSGSFVVTDKNGTNYSFPGVTSPQGIASVLLWPVIEDRNGNQITLFPTGSNALYTDSAGRPGPIVTNTSVTINANTPDQLVFTPVWESIPVSYTISTVDGGEPPAGVSCPWSIPTTVSGTRVVLKSLTLPNGESYQFSYGQMGVLAGITYPDGGWVEYNWTLPTGSNNGQYNQIAFWSGTQKNMNQDGTYYWTPVPYGCSQLYQTPILSSRTVSFDGTTVAQTQTYAYSTTWASSGGSVSGWSAKQTTVTTTDGKTGQSSTTVYNYIPWGVPAQPYASGVTAPNLPFESEIDYSDWGQTAITRKVNKTWHDQFNLASETTTIVKTGQVSKTVYSYVTGLGSSPSSSSFVYLSEQDDYDYSSSSTPIKKTIYNYRNPVTMPTNFPPYTTFTQSTDEYPMMFPPLVSSVTIENGSGAILASTNYSYDGSALTTVSPTQHDANYNTSMTTRGNLTSVTRCNPVPATAGGSCTGPTVSYAYDTSGQPTSMTDANGNTTAYSFADNFSDDTTAPSTNAYLTSVTYPSTAGGNLTESFEYSYYLGYLTYSTDENGQTTSYHYGTEASQCTTSDLLDRLTEVDYPDGGKTQHCYSDTAPNPTVQTWKLINSSSSLWEESITTEDGMGHVVETQLTTDPGGTDTVLTTYTGEGKVFTVTNPFRGSSPPANTTTTNYYDVFGRPIKTTQQDGSTRQWCYDDFASSPAVANCSALLATVPLNGPITVKSGTWFDSTDENGNHWQHTSDVFGDLTDVVEPNGASQNPTMETQYTYDVLKDLLTVAQCGALCTSPATNGPISRSFSYNSLAQLVSGTNPETGTESYTYDLNGNVLTKVSPALNGNTGTQTLGYCYDPLNRLVGKWSASPPNGCNSTPTTAPASLLATYKFGGVSDPTYHTGGRLIDARSYLNSKLISDDTPSQYDSMGRLLMEGQCLSSGGCAPPFYVNNTYDQAGDVTFTDNGLASVYTDLGFSFTYDGAQHMSVAQTTTESPNFPAATYPPVLLQANGTSNPSYDAWGHLINGQMGLTSVGAGTPVIQTTRTFDNRGRVTAETDGSFYSFTVQNGSSSGYDSVGNLKYYQDSVMGNWTYNYDTLNRLTTAQDTATTSVSTQFAGAYGCWTYDGFGNRTKEALSNVTSTPCANGANDNLQLTTTTPTAKNQASNFTYDLAGNVLNDNSNQYVYDAEGRLCAVAYPNGTGISYDQYTYDASGARVLKLTLQWAGSGSLNFSTACSSPISDTYWTRTVTSMYLLGVGGEQVTELNGGETILHTNVFAGGKLLSTYDFNGSNHGAGLHFALADTLGTKRAQVLATGAGTGTLELQCMSLPFGNGLGNPRVTDCVGSGTDATEHHFTGKERDTESGNDYFEARYYSSAVGRFMTPDWSAKVEPVPYSKLDDPQSLNLYAYVMNNPLARVDGDGHAPLSWGGFESCGSEYAAIGCGAGSQTSDDMAHKSAFDAQQAAQQQNALQSAGQKAASGPYGSNVISVNGNTTTVPLYNGRDSSAEIIGTQAITNNLNSQDSGTIKIVNTNQSVAGSPTETITMRLKNGLTQGISVRSSDGSVNMDSSTSFNSHNGQATVTMVNHNTNTVNVRVYDTAGGSGPVLRFNTTYDTAWVP